MKVTIQFPEDISAALKAQRELGILQRPRSPAGSKARSRRRARLVSIPRRAGPVPELVGNQSRPRGVRASACVSYKLKSPRLAPSEPESKGEVAERLKAAVC